MTTLIVYKDENWFREGHARIQRTDTVLCAGHLSFIDLSHRIEPPGLPTEHANLRARCTESESDVSPDEMGSIRSPNGAGPPGSLRVCLGSFTQPWSFGPYARQLTVLAGQLAKKHVVMWLALGYHDTQVRIKVPGLPDNVGMVGGGFPRNQGVYVSSINSLLKQHNMDVFISLMDLNRMPHRPRTPDWQTPGRSATHT